MNQLDLNAPPRDHTLSIAINRDEFPSERKVRLFKDVALFVSTLGLVALVVSVCFHTLHNVSAGAEEKKWAMSILSACTGGMVGYLVKR